jgi:hypothetical protein
MHPRNRVKGLVCNYKIHAIKKISGENKELSVLIPLNVLTAIYPVSAGTILLFL